MKKISLWVVVKYEQNKYISISHKLKVEKGINKEFEILLNSLSIEEILSLKLELMCKLLNGKFCFPLYHILDSVVKESVLNFAESSKKTQKEICLMLGIKLDTFKKMRKKYNTSQYLIIKNNNEELYF